MKKLMMVMVLGASAVAASAQGLQRRSLGSRLARPRPQISESIVGKEAIKVIPTAREGGTAWKYRESAKPLANWGDLSFDDKDWKEGVSGFGNSYGLRRTVWGGGANDLYLRKTFSISSTTGQIERVTLTYAIDDDIEVLLNGAELFSRKIGRFAKYASVDVTKDFKRLVLEPGKENVIAVKAHDRKPPCYADVGLEIVLSDTNQGQKNVSAPPAESQSAAHVADVALIPFGGTDWKYKMQGVVEENWKSPDFNDASWANGKTPFGNRDDFITSWTTPCVCMRKRFDCPYEDADIKYLQIREGIVNMVDIWLNGSHIYHWQFCGNRNLDLTTVIPRKLWEGLLRRKDNVLTVLARDWGKPQFVNVGLIAMVRRSVGKEFVCPTEYVPADMKLMFPATKLVDIQVCSAVLTGDSVNWGRPTAVLASNIKSFGDLRKTMQFQRLEVGCLKCACVELEQKGRDVWGRVLYCRSVEHCDVSGVDFDTLLCPTHRVIDNDSEISNGQGAGYGLKEFTAYFASGVDSNDACTGVDTGLRRPGLLGGSLRARRLQREQAAAASEAQVKGTVAKCDFKAKLTGIAIIEGGRMCGYEERANNAEFLSPDTPMEIPYGKAACFRVEYDFPEGYQARVWIRDRWQKGEDGSSYYFGSNPSPLYKGKGIAYGFLDMLERGKSCTLKQLAIRTNAEPKLEEPPKEWDIVVTPVDIKFQGPETAQKVPSKESEKVILNNQMQGTNAVADKLQSCDFLLNKDFKKNAKFYLCLFSASWCPPCRREMPRIAKTYAETLKNDPDIELIHFSRDQNDEKALAWAKEHDVKFPVVKPKGSNPLDLHSRGIPHLFIVKADGTLLEEGHPMRLFSEKKLKEITGKENDLDQKPVASSGKRDFALQGEIRKLLSSAQPRKKITVPCNDSPKDLPLFKDPVEAQRKAKELGLWMFVYNMPCSSRGKFYDSTSFRKFLSRYCVLLKIDDSDSKFLGECPWIETGCWPMCRILDSNGRLVSPIAKWSGMQCCEVSDEKMTEIFKGFLRACEIMPVAFDVVARNPDENGLAKLHDSLSALPEAFVKIAYSEWAALLLKLDRDGNRGWRSCYSYAQQDEPVGGYKWPFRIANGEATIVSEKRGPGCKISPNPTGKLSIPSTLGGARVTGIGRFALVDCKDITSVEIPSSVTNISTRAFARCKKLTSFSVDPENPSYSSRNGFLCSKDGRTLVAGLNGDVVIPSCVTHIGDDAFFQCEGVTSVRIPSSVRSIGWKAFDQCRKLMSFSVDEHNSSYSSREGFLCSKDGSTLVEGLNGDVVIPACVRTIGDNAFSGRSGLTSVTIPEGVTCIGRSAFFWCIKLTAVKIPSSVTRIEDNAFEWCYGLSDITVDDNNAFYCSVDGVLYNKAKTEMLHFPQKKRGTMTMLMIPPGVARIAHGMFSGCSRVPSVSIPASVTSIGRGAFSYCRELTSVKMLGDKPSVGGKIFDNCDKLAAIHVPANAKSWAGMKEWQGIPLVFDAEAMK